MNFISTTSAVARTAASLVIPRSGAADRAELIGSTDVVARLKVICLICRIVPWTLRSFIPNSDGRPSFLARLLDRHPLTWAANRSTKLEGRTL